MKNLLTTLQPAFETPSNVLNFKTLEVVTTIIIFAYDQVTTPYNFLASQPAYDQHIVDLMSVNTSL